MLKPRAVPCPASITCRAWLPENYAAPHYTRHWQAAERLFAEHGFEATTVAQIAQTAGVGERTFYRYFDSKEDLLAERAITWIGLLGEAIRARPAAETPYQAVAGR